MAHESATGERERADLLAIISLIERRNGSEQQSDNGGRPEESGQIIRAASMHSRLVVRIGY